MPITEAAGTVRDIRRAAPAADRAPPAIRWAGAVLALCTLTVTVTAILYMTVYGQPAGTGAEGAVTIADRAAHMLERWTLISSIWLVETAAWVLMALAGFVLQHRNRRSGAWLPARVAWTAVGVGAVVQLVMYAFMLGGYPAAAAEVDAVPALLDSLNQAATFLFHLGNTVLYLGLAGALFAEAAPDGAIPRWLALVGGTACVIETVLFGGLVAGVGQLAFAGPGGVIGTLAASWLGLSIWRRG